MIILKPWYNIVVMIITLLSVGGLMACNSIEITTNSSELTKPAPIFNTAISPSLDPSLLESGQNFARLNSDWNPDPKALADLINAAKSEGSVYWTGYNQTQIDTWCEAFTTEFDIVCSGRGVSAMQIISSLTAESTAKQPKTDVVYLSMSQMAQYFDRRLASSVDWVSLGVDNEKIWSDGANGNAVGVILSHYTHFANTNYINEIPSSSVFDWSDPKYHGLICAPDFLLRAGNGFLGLMYEPEAMIDLHRYLINSNDMLVTNDCDALLLSGERPLTYMGYGLPFDLLDGGHIRPFWNPGMGTNLFSHAIASDAPHPNAAKLFAAWSSSQRAANLSWTSIRQGWPAYGVINDIAPNFNYKNMVFESPDTYRLRAERTRYFQDALFGK